MEIRLIRPELKSSPRPAGVDLDTIVLHSTAGRERPDNSVANAVSTLRSKGYAYHYLIARDGTIYKGCASMRMCSHAGSSYGPQEQAAGVSMKQYPYNSSNVSKKRVHHFEAGCSVNRYSIGISFVNMNDGSESYTDAQIEACQTLITVLAGSLPTIRYVTTHYEVSPKRKSDPFGPGFDLDAMGAKVDLEVWKFPDRARVERP